MRIGIIGTGTIAAAVVEGLAGDDHRSDPQPDPVGKLGGRFGKVGSGRQSGRARRQRRGALHATFDRLSRNP